MLPAVMNAAYGGSSAVFGLGRCAVSRKVPTACGSLLIGLLACPVGLGAQNEPFLGVWELNLTKSSITRGAPPKSETIVNTPEAGGYRSLLAVVTPMSTAVEIQHFAFDGAFHQTEGSDPRELSFTRTDARTIEQETRRGSEITVHRRITLAADGKTITYVANGKSGNGTPYSNDTRVYEKR
jgi:hypothetical protein